MRALLSVRITMAGNGVASGKDLLVGTNTVTEKVTTVIRGTNLTLARFILQRDMEILYNILHDKSNRQKLISEFQEMVWSSDERNELLSQLAYDLDFYEPDDTVRAEDSSFYGDNKLEVLLKEALEKINFKVSEKTHGE